MPDLQQTKDVFELLSYIVVALGVPTGLLQYFRAKKAEQVQREARIYDALYTDYTEFQKLCLQYAYLDVSDHPDPFPAALTPQQEKEEGILFSILFSIFERAYLLYRDNPTAITAGQWRGWELYIKQYLQRPNFRRAWTAGENTYDPRFNVYMNGMMAAVHESRSNALSDPAGTNPSVPS